MAHSGSVKSGPGGRARGQGARRVYEALREDILSMAIAPGAALDEVQLAGRYQLSRSPVREALIRLSSEGLVRMLPNRSSIVAPLETEHFGCYLDALDLTQRATTSLAARLRTDADLERIRASQREFERAVLSNDPLSLIESNRNFHVAVSEAGHNPYLTSLYTRLLDEGRRFLRIYFRSYDDRLPPEFPVEHVRIIDAIEARDADLAERLAHEHAVQMGDRFLSHLGTRHAADIAVRYADAG